MKRYFFDLRDGDELTPDDEGLELSTMEAVQEEAARSLAPQAALELNQAAEAEQGLDLVLPTEGAEHACEVSWRRDLRAETSAAGRGGGAGRFS